MKIFKKKRKFEVGLNSKININHIANLKLKNNEQITIVYNKNSNYDVVKKSWGFYATPSINFRLINNSFKTALVKNKFEKYFIMIVHNAKLIDFNKTYD